MIAMQKRTKLALKLTCDKEGNRMELKKNASDRFEPGTESNIFYDRVQRYQKPK